MMNNIYTDILNSINLKDLEKNHYNSRVLVIDSMNMFIRGFSVLNYLNENGHHVGGLVGYLRSLGYCIKLINPTRVILVFDGVGSTINKKYLYPEYKGTRNITKITNWEIFESKHDEKESMNNQMIRLIQYLQNLPVSLISIDKIEADDSIAYITKKLYNEYTDSNITIVSSDNDFLQLLNDRTTVYSPIKKKFYYPDNFFNEYGMIPENYVLMKTITGDKSDNLPGVRGIQDKKLFKLYPFLKETNQYTINDIYKYSNDNIDKNKLYQTVLERKHQIDVNHTLMNLIDLNIPMNAVNELDECLSLKPDPFNKSQFLNLYNQDRLGRYIPNVDIWLNECFNQINSYI
jgi:5'-3' exonuclease